ncbi:MAG: hypothetical protein JNM22_05520 [Saprospiraceae bacterium]|nr:hypothetical protein [Saprospiraceae bacterium]
MFHVVASLHGSYYFVGYCLLVAVCQYSGSVAGFMLLQAALYVLSAAIDVSEVVLRLVALAPDRLIEVDQVDHCCC